MGHLVSTRDSLNVGYFALVSLSERGNAISRLHESRDHDPLKNLFSSISLDGPAGAHPLYS